MTSETARDAAPDSAHDGRPLLVFDGDCGFCTWCVRWLEARQARPVRIEPWQVLDLDALGLSEQDVSTYAWWLEGGPGARGRKERGHRAIARALLACRMPWPILGRLLLLPPISWLGPLGYRLIARNRGHLPGATPACAVKPKGENDA